MANIVDKQKDFSLLEVRPTYCRFSLSEPLHIIGILYGGENSDNTLFRHKHTQKHDKDVELHIETAQKDLVDAIEYLSSKKNLFSNEISLQSFEHLLAVLWRDTIADEKVIEFYGYAGIKGNDWKNSIETHWTLRNGLYRAEKKIGDKYKPQQIGALVYLEQKYRLNRISLDEYIKNHNGTKVANGTNISRRRKNQTDSIVLILFF